MRILITGVAGFIGFHLARKLLNDGHFVVGYDGVTTYYDPKLKEARLALLARFGEFNFQKGLLEDRPKLELAASICNPDVIIHLAAQAGVRYSLESPETYVSSNLVGTFNVMEVARAARVRHLLLASSSSVYGGNTKMPFTETDRTDLPLTIYAATKKSTEVMTHSYAHLWKIPTTAFRFFTVYGPWGRPDMALFKFAKAIRAGEPIDVYAGGEMKRDFTYVDDLVESVVRLTAVPPVEGQSVSAPGVEDSLSPVAPWRSVNIAGGHPVKLLDLIEEIEAKMGKRAVRNILPMQAGDVKDTFADNGLLRALTGFCPATPLSEGVLAFVNWFNQYQDKADFNS